ncbi:ATP-dependent DNA helicase PIF1-like protein, partial [Tanacetum coccineum]
GCYNDDDYLKERAILTPRSDKVDAINAYMFKKLAGEIVTYNTADEICKASTDTLDQHNPYPLEFLNILNFPGMPPHSLCLIKELPIMLIQNVNPSKGICNGIQLIITELGQPCYAMTINKSQGQSLNHFGLYLPNPVFSHGQLYVALSRVTDPGGLKILMIPDENKELHNHTKNLVFKETFNNLT